MTKLAMARWAYLALLLLLSPAAGQEFDAAAPDGAELEGEPLGEEEAEDEEEEPEEIETDRDSFTPAVATVPFGRSIVESAYSFIDNRNVPETHSFPELIVRHGVADWLELRLGWNYEIGGAGSPVSGNVPGDFADSAAIEEESRCLYGFKAQLTEQCDFVPSSIVMLQGFTPTSGAATDTEMCATYAVGWQLANCWTWDSAMRYSTGGEEDDNFNVWAPSTVLKVPVGERWKAHAEYFGIFTSGRADETEQHYVSPGVHYLVTPDLEVGVRVGWGLSDDSANFFANVGFGWQF